MNTSEYIASGILEAYVLGSVTPQEKQEVECLSKIYPEIKTELTTIEETMETYAKMHEVKPSAQLKSKIFAQMNFDQEIEEGGNVLENETQEEIIEREVKVIPMWSKIAVAASVVFGLLLGWTFQNSREISNELAATKAQMESEKALSSKSEGLLALYKDSKNVPMELKGVEKSPDSKVMAFWNKETEEMKLMVENLPAVPKGKQYQVWGIVDGKPVDMGMIDLNFENKILAMKVPKGNIAAFAITLEKQGGSPTPTLEEMYVIGNV
ncbi:anti-sigma factor [Lacihabitans sp. CCS-44]|uniref:anti-sigma factor n=1 Tax=Lacihabitans sp. CCS-44 TaxID=2487331 RepID=UPI0020CF39D9|nr:anti-sigma factor [Lacihabitans sp. CCS-44]MCP9755719.1 anti-sigma factor [Lacihabitans sp. CCS-44]